MSVEITPDQRACIQEIVELFDLAEKYVKEIEQLAQELSIPSVNELRYVGYHLARALASTDHSELDTQVQKAKGHCKRAIYDAHELGIIYCLEQIQAFKQRHEGRGHIVAKVIHDYSACLSKATKASRFIAEANENGRHDRDSYYKKCRPHFEEIRSVCDKFDQIGPEVDAAKDQHDQDTRRSTRRFQIQISLAILTVVVSIVIGVTIISLNSAPDSPEETALTSNL